MSYTGRVGSYYQFTPGQVYNDPHYDNGKYHHYSGVGACGCGGSCGCGGCCGLGAAAFEFTASKIWADYLTCKACPPTCTACASAVNSVRAALSKLGYGELPMGAPWGPQDQAAYKKWVADHGLPPSPAGPGMIAQAHLPVMEKQLKAGETPGPQQSVQYENVDGTFVKKGAGLAGTGGWIGVGIVAIAVGGGLYLISKMRKGKKTL